MIEASVWFSCWTLHVLLRLQRLVQPFREAAARHHAPGELVDDDDAPVLHDVVGVALEHLVGADCLVQVVHHRDVLDVVEVGALQQLVLGEQGLDALRALVGERRGAGLLVDLEVALFQLGDHAVDLLVHLRAVLGGAGDDQRRARLVDQDAVDLVDDGEVEGALDHGLQRELHVVAQVVEAELVVGPVGHVGAVLLAPLLVVEAVHDAADLEAEELVDLAHPGGVALGQVVVHRDDVDALAFQGVQIDRQCRDQGLALAGRHLRDLALVEHDAAHELHVVVALAEGALRGLSRNGEGLDEQVLQGLAVGDPLLERRGLGAKLVVAQGFQRALEVVDRTDLPGVGLDDALVDRAEQLLGKPLEHGVFPTADARRRPRRQ